MKSKKNPLLKKPALVLTICKDCKIRLVVKKKKSQKCDLCGSPNISAEAWKHNRNEASQA